LAKGKWWAVYTIVNQIIQLLSEEKPSEETKFWR
jgi:hypothetical protein